MEEPDIHIRAEGVDISEGGVSHASGGMAIVHKLANVRAAAADALEPGQRKPAHLIQPPREPGIDGGIAPNGVRKPHELAGSSGRGHLV